MEYFAIVCNREVLNKAPKYELNAREKIANGEGANGN